MKEETWFGRKGKRVVDRTQNYTKEKGEKNHGRLDRQAGDFFRTYQVLFLLLASESTDFVLCLTCCQFTQTE